METLSIIGICSLIISVSGFIIGSHYILHSTCCGWDVNVGNNEIEISNGRDVDIEIKNNATNIEIDLNKREVFEIEK